MGKKVEQTGLFNFGMATGLGEGKQGVYVCSTFHENDVT